MISASPDDDWFSCTAANFEASWPSRRAAKAASMRLSAGRSLCLLHLSEQNFTSVAAVFAEFDFLEPGRVESVSFCPLDTCIVYLVSRR